MSELLLLVEWIPNIDIRISGYCIMWVKLTFIAQSFTGKFRVLDPWCHKYLILLHITCEIQIILHV